jgi:hypothetical protein
MRKRFDEIARRKEILIERCARDRKELAAALHQIHLPLHLGAILTKAGKLLQAYPLVAGLSSLLVTGYGLKLMRTAGKFVAMARIISPVWSWWSKRRRAK